VHTSPNNNNQLDFITVDALKQLYSYNVFLELVPISTSGHEGIVVAMRGCHGEGMLLPATVGVP